MNCFYYAALSRLRLEATCEALQKEFSLPDFTFDSHDNWRYAWSECGGTHLNVTKASDETTITTWMSTCPAGVNYQIILTAKDEPEGFLSFLTKVLGSPVRKYDVLPAP